MARTACKDGQRERWAEKEIPIQRPGALYLRWQCSVKNQGLQLTAWLARWRWAVKPAAQNPSTGRSLAQASRLDPLGDFPRSLLEELPNVTSAAPRERAQRACSTPAPRNKRCGQNGILRPKPRIDAARMASGIASRGRGLFAWAWGLIHLSPLWWAVQRRRSQRGPAKRIERHYRRVVEALLPTARIHRV